MKILITGGCGFIGTSLIPSLKRTFGNATILVYDNFSAGTPHDLGEVTSYSICDAGDIPEKVGTYLIEGDICDATTVLEVASGVSTIVHLAANTGVAPSVSDPRMDMESNVIGTFNLLEAARKNAVKKFIFASSGAPAGVVSPPIHEELPPHPISPYGASKLAGEGYCSAYSNTFGISTVCLRFGNVYGPRSKNKSSVIAKFIRQAVHGVPCEIYGDGLQTRDFIYIDDLIEAILHSITAEVQCETFQIAAGVEKTVGEVVEIIADLLLKKGITMSVSHEAPRLGDVPRNFSDTSKAKAMLNWQAKMNLRKGIEKTIEYFLASHKTLK